MLGGGGRDRRTMLALEGCVRSGVGFWEWNCSVLEIGAVRESCFLVISCRESLISVISLETVVAEVEESNICPGRSMTANKSW